MSLLDSIFPPMLSGIVARPPVFPRWDNGEGEDPEKKLQDKVDSLTDIDDYVDEAYLKKLVRKLGVKNITIVSLCHNKDYQVGFSTPAPDAERATITTKKKFSTSLYIGQQISK